MSIGIKNLDNLPYPKGLGESYRIIRDGHDTGHHIDVQPDGGVYFALNTVLTVDELPILVEALRRIVRDHTEGFYCPVCGSPDLAPELAQWGYRAPSGHAYCARCYSLTTREKQRMTNKQAHSLRATFADFFEDAKARGLGPFALRCKHDGLPKEWVLAVATAYFQPKPWHEADVIHGPIDEVYGDA